MPVESIGVHVRYCYAGEPEFGRFCGMILCSLVLSLSSADMLDVDEELESHRSRMASSSLHDLLPHSEVARRPC